MPGETGKNESGRRVMEAFAFKRPDRIPRFDTFWDYPEEWQEALGDRHALSDILIRVPEEGTFPTRVRFLKREGSWEYFIDNWGRTCRRKAGTYFLHTLSVPVPPGVDPDEVPFDPPELESRYPLDELAEQKKHYCVFGKTGGPYLRSTYLRGEEDFLMDIAADPSLAKALADRVADHLIAVASEQLKRWDLYDTGIWIYDDMGDNRGPIFGPGSFERVFLPAYRRMIAAYKQAGARYVILHSDGNIMPILDMLVDAGIDGINPVERKSGMDPESIRRRYPHLVIIGGMCNARTLPFGTVAEVAAEARKLIDLGREGGLVIGAHSIGSDIPLGNFLAYHETCLGYGNFAGHGAGIKGLAQGKETFLC